MTLVDLVERDMNAEPGEHGLDPSLLQAAKHIYQTFHAVHPEVIELPAGVAINRFTYRGKLIFSGKPILLPQEQFIPFELIRS
ncbi:MAG: hypothetical protein VKJ24_10610 [Synechococcales bacterium]|nr:hypothetical protein [Synechococcales bacterium]